MCYWFVFGWIVLVVIFEEFVDLGELSYVVSRLYIEWGEVIKVDRNKLLKSFVKVEKGEIFKI